MPFTIIRQDITRMKVDAIVNAANTGLRMGGGVCGAVFRAAGMGEMIAACAAVGGCKTGGAVITPGFKLDAKYVIHAVGPVYQDGTKGEAALLRSCYLSALRLAKENKCASIAFPLISSGIYGYPKAEAFGIAAAAIADFLSENEMDIYLAVFDKAALSVSETLMGEVKRFVDENYVAEQTLFFSRREPEEMLERAMDLEACMPAVQPVQAAGSAKKAAAAKANKSLESMICDLDESFSETLLRLIDKTGESDAAVYKRANIDRRHFSKIRSNPAYVPSKRTVLAFAVALHLSVEETKDLLSRAGFALSRSHKMDVIVEYFIRSGNYDIQTINQVLFGYDQPLLGG